MGEAAQQLETGIVRPVDVFEYEQRRLLRDEAIERE
jgi:hypothetical protein